MSIVPRSKRHLARFVLVLALAEAAMVASSHGASAQCELETGEGSFDVRDARNPGDAIELRTDDSLTVSRPAGGLLNALVWVGPAPLPIPTTGDEGDSVTVDLGDVSWVTVGLYRVDIFGPGAGECSGTFWVKIEGRSPLTTVAGIAAITAAVGGALLVARAAERGRRQRCSIRRGVIGGMVAGLGASSLAQQFAVLPMLVPVIIAALVLPALVGGLVARAACVHVPLPCTLTPLLTAPLVVVAGEYFDARVGVGIAAAGAKRSGDHEVTAQVVASGAVVAEGETWRHVLTVRPGRELDDAHVRMRASRDIGASHLTVLYSSGGQTIGMARRPLWVVAPETLPPPEVGDGVGRETVGAAFRLPVEQQPVDLELRATYAGPRALQRLQWTVETPHRDWLAVPDDPFDVDLGSDPESFAAGLLVDVTENEGRAGLDELLLGTGRQLARLMDPRLMALVAQVLDRPAGAPARVLLLTEESSVPWELLAVEPAPAGTPPFLATRAVVGRWFLAAGAATLPPPVVVEQVVREVIATDVLPAARVEAKRLESDFAFHVSPPTVSSVLDALERSDTVHLACHGSWRQDQDRCVLELSDGRVVPRHVAGLRLAHRPFVFLNACQVAAGGEALGAPTGFPAELVFAGASGCVSPLWSVRDDQAYEIAVAFYRQVLDGRPPAEVIRELRWRAAVDGLPTSTPFAYQFVGHPDLHLVTVAATAARPAATTPTPTPAAA